MEYCVLEYENLDSYANQLDVPFSELEKQMNDARAMGGSCVYFRRYKEWHWIVIDGRLPIDWVMALVLA